MPSSGSGSASGVITGGGGWPTVDDVLQRIADALRVPVEDLPPYVTEPVADKGQGLFDWPASTKFPKSADALAPFFSTASLANYCETQLRTWG